MANPMKKDERPGAKLIRNPESKAFPVKTRLVLDVTPVLYEKLCELTMDGLYGFSPEEAAERLIAEQLRRILPKQ